MLKLNFKTGNCHGLCNISLSRILSRNQTHGRQIKREKKKKEKATDTRFCLTGDVVTVYEDK